MSPGALARVVRSAADRRGAKRVLLLDLDGTLADVEARPEHVRGLPIATRHALSRLLATGWSIAIVTGRSRDDAERIVSVPRVAVFGSHGGVGPEGSILTRSRRLATRLELGGIARSIAALARAYDAVQIECKPLAIAVHHRGLEHGERAPWRSRLQRRLPSGRATWLEAVRGKAVDEVRPRGIHKGLVLDRFGPTRTLAKVDLSVVAVGDDRTDEDLFRALGRRGLRVRVGDTPSANLVDATLATPLDVGAFLAELCG